MIKLLIFPLIFCIILVNAQQPNQISHVSSSATNNLNQLVSQSRQQLLTIYRASEQKLREINSNRGVNDTIKAVESAQIRRMLKNQINNWRNTLNEKIIFLEKDMQNSIDLVFEQRPTGITNTNTIY